jgi:hypothetical protein
MLRYGGEFTSFPKGLDPPPMITTFPQAAFSLHRAAVAHTSAHFSVRYLGEQWMC